MKRELLRAILGDNAKDEKTVVILNLEGGLHRVRGRRTACSGGLVWLWIEENVERTGHAEHPGGFREPQ